MMSLLRPLAQFSRLAFTDCSDIQEEPAWRPSEWPPLPGGWRLQHTSVVVDHPDKDQGQIVIVLGGYHGHGSDLNSVLLLNVDDHKKGWREARARLNEARSLCAVVVCNGALYAIGGEYDETQDSSLSTIERIYITDLVYSSFASNTNNYQWTTLECRLSDNRGGCAAAVVQDRFIVVAGGEYRDVLSSVDIIDTCSQSQCSVISGPPMNVARTCFGMAVVGSRIYVVGGRGVYDDRAEDDPYYKNLGSVEYLDCDDWLTEGPPISTSMSPSTKSWNIHNDLVLGTPRYNHGMVRVGSCLVVVGGGNSESAFHFSKEPLLSAEVLDTQRNFVWELPEMKQGKQDTSVVAVSTGIVTIGVEALSLVDKHSLCFLRLMALGKSPYRPKVLKQGAEPSDEVDAIATVEETSKGIKVMQRDRKRHKSDSI